MPENENNGGENNGAGNGSAWTPPASQEDFNRIIGERVSRERSKFADYSDLKSKATQFDQLTASQQTELQQAEARAQTAEQTAQQSAGELARTKAALKYKLSEEDLDLLPTAGTPDEIDARAKKLSERLAPKAPDFDGGGRSTANTGQNMNQFIRKAAGLG